MKKCKLFVSEDERMTLLLSDKTIEVVNNLANEYGISRGEVFSRALALLATAKVHKAAGNNLVFLDKNGKVVTRVTGI